MTSNRPCLRDKYTLCIYGILIISALLPALLAVKHIKISPDSMIYALISQEVLSGNGLQLPIIYDLKDSYTFNNGAVPYLAQPPLLPLLFSLLGGVSHQSYLPAQLINVLCHVSIAIFTFLLIKKLYDNSGTALLTGMLTALAPPLIWNTHRMLSEPLFIAMSTASIYFLVLSRHSEDHNYAKHLIIAGVCASAAILTRIPGVALIPVLFWNTLVLVKNRTIKSKWLPALISLLLPVVTCSSFFVRNYLVSGTIVGWSPDAPGRSYLDAFTGTVKMMFNQFYLPDNLIPLLIAALILSIFFILLNRETRRRSLECFNSGLDLILVFVLGYTAVITQAMSKVQPLFELRYISPLVPFLFIACVLIISLFWKAIRLKGLSRLAVPGMILSFAILFSATLYKTYVNSEDLFSRQMGHYRMLSSPTYSWIKENFGENEVITSNRPFHLSFFGGYSTIRMPHKRYYKNFQMSYDMRTYLPERMSNFGSKVLVLFDRADEKYEGEYIARLFHQRKSDDMFTLVHDSPDGVVYTLKE